MNSLSSGDIQALADAGFFLNSRQFEDALSRYLDVKNKTAIVLFNIGRCYKNLGDYEEAIEMLLKSSEKDKYLAVAYFEIGSCHFLQGTVEDAQKYYEKAAKCLLSRHYINYQQLGMDFILDIEDIMFNVAVCMFEEGDPEKADRRIKKISEYIAQSIFSSSFCETKAGSLACQFRKTYLGDMGPKRDESLTHQKSKSLDSLREGSRMSSREVRKAESEIYKDLQNKLNVSDIIEIPESCAFRPSKRKMSGLGSFDYLGEAKVLASIDVNNIEAGFRDFRIRAKEKSISDASSIASTRSYTINKR